MRVERPATPQPWMLFAVPVAIAVPIIVAIMLGGPTIGLPVAALVALAIVAVAIRMRPRRRNVVARRSNANGSDGAEPAEPPNGSWMAAAARRFAMAAVIVAAGVVVVVTTRGIASIIGWGVLATGLMLAVSLVFLEIGYSEDRARAREERRRARVAPPPHGSARSY